MFTTTQQRILKGFAIGLMAAALTSCGIYQYPDNSKALTASGAGASSNPVASGLTDPNATIAGLNSDQFNNAVNINHGTTFYVDTMHLVQLLVNRPDGVRLDVSYTNLIGIPGERRVIQSAGLTLRDTDVQLGAYFVQTSNHHDAPLGASSRSTVNSLGGGIQMHLPILRGRLSMNYQLGIQAYRNQLVRRLVAGGKAQWFQDTYQQRDYSGSFTISKVMDHYQSQFLLYAGYRLVVSRQSPITETLEDGSNRLQLVKQYSASQSILGGVGYRYQPQPYPGLNLVVNYNVAYRLVTPSWLIAKLSSSDADTKGYVFKPHEDVSYFQHQVSAGVDYQAGRWLLRTRFTALGYTQWTYGFNVGFEAKF